MEPIILLQIAENKDKKTSIRQLFFILRGEVGRIPVITNFVVYVAYEGPKQLEILVCNFSK